MKKITGKVVSLVLALALVVSSFSANFAFASTKTISGTITDTDNDELYLCDGDHKTVDLKEWLIGDDLNLETKDHEEATGVKIKAVSHSSGDKLVSASIDSDDEDAELKLKGKTGKEVLSVLYEGDYSDDDYDYTVKARQELTVYVYDEGDIVFGEAIDDDYKPGDGLDEFETFAKNEGAEKDIGIYRAVQSKDAKAKFDEVVLVNQKKGIDLTKIDDPIDSTKKLSERKNPTDDIYFYEMTSGEKDIHIVGLDEVADEKVTATEKDNKITVVGKAGDLTADAVAEAVNKLETVTATVEDDKGDTKLTATTEDVELADGAEAETEGGTTTPAVPAKVEKDGLKVTATEEYTGIAGNDITVEIKANAEATDEKVTVSVNKKAITVTGKSANLTAAKIAEAIGADTDGAAKLVTAEGDVDVTTELENQTLKLADGAEAKTEGGTTTPAVPAKATIQKVLTVEAVKAGEAGNNISVAIEVTENDEKDENAAVAVNSVLHAVIGKTKDDAIDGDASTGNVTINVKKLEQDSKIDKTYKNSSDSDDKFTLKSKIEKKIDVAYIDGYDATTSCKVEKTNSSTYLTGFGKEDVKVKDCEIVFPDDYAGKVSINEDSTIKAVTGTVDEVYVGDAKVDYIDLDNGDVEVSDGKVGDITTGEEDVVLNGLERTGKVTVTDGTVGNIDTTELEDVGDAGKVEIDGGTVGNIDSEDEVTIKSDDEDETVTVGAVTAPEIDAFADDAVLNIKSIKSSDDNGTFLLKGEKLNVNSIDMDYYDTTLQLGEDDDEFIGTIPAPKNAEDATIEVDSEDSRVKVTGAVDVDTISIDTDAKIAFDDKVTVDSIDGDGEMKIVAGKLYVEEDASSVILKLADTTLAAGQTVFKCDEDAVDEDDFDCFGFTLEKSEGNKVDTFKIKSLSFAGPAINKTSSKIAKGYSETFTASAYPAGTALPKGATIKWELDGGSTDVFKLTTKDNTAKVEVVSLDEDFASENHTVLKAYLYDEDGDEMDDYDPAECEITALKVPEAVSDTTCNFALAQGASYQFKITSATQPSFAVGTAGVFSSALVAKNGNDYFYKITAIGKPGKDAGIYLNGEKLLVASIKAPAFKCDTTMKTTVKGAYTIKVTADKTPSFAVGTAGVFKANFVSKNGNDYFYKITSVGNKGTDAGIYVNGVRAFVAVVG